MTTIMQDDDSITVRVEGHEVAKFIDCGNGMDGEIFEGDHSRMSASDLIAIARFILSKASDRAEVEEQRP